MRTPLATSLVSLLAVCLVAAPARSDLILSELCDPRNNFSTDRYIEIYNTGASPVDLTGWSVVAVANAVDVCTWTLSGTLNPGQAKVCGNTTTVTGFTVHFPSATWATAYTNWNGGNAGDGARLRAPGGAVVDLVYGTTPYFENGTLVRIPSVTAPSATFHPAEWTFTAVLLATDATPGTHNGSPPPPPGPVISNVVTDPASPSSGIPVDVQADVVDTVGTIQAVTLSWGTSSTSLPNVIGMPLLGGATYRTSSQIPGQPGGATIYYRVRADSDSSSSQTAVLSYTLPGGGGGVPPAVLAVGQMSDSTLLVNFTEPIEPVTGETAANYTVGALPAVAAARDPLDISRVLITVRGLTAGTQTLTVNGVSDVGGDIAFGATRSFNYVDVTIPPGYYDGALGKVGSALRVALHDIIRNHTVKTYSYALTAFQTTDVKWNGKVWDMYSDIPGGTPPYEYSFGQTGQGATEGLGYNREHSWPASWFNDASPMYSDLWILYPTDSKVNGYRANLAYGAVGTPTTTSWNGSKVGPSATPGYTGTVFEPIDAFKGDLARGQFYVATRYFGQDGSWPGGPSADGAEILPWAVTQYLAWSLADPVSWKERMRNGAVYAIQGNRNPFVDHPEFLTAIYDSSAVAGVEDAPVTRRMLRNSPNPFRALTTLAFELPRAERVTLRVYDIGGRRVRTLAEARALAPGAHRFEWDGRDDAGAPLQAGLYFARLEAGEARETRRMARMR